MTDWLLAGTWEELQEQGAKVIKGGIAVFVHADEVYAVDNRCPHMGFPLHMGSLCDGILTCHWHHARFDVCSGGTLDPWADDVPVHRVKVEQGSVWVDPRPQVASCVEKQLRRLREGMEQNLSLVIAKSVVALVESGVPAADIARVGVEFGTTYRSAGWSSGLTILAAMVNVLPKLDKYGRILALYHGLASVARDCAGQPARFLQQPLPETEQQATEHLSAWYRRCMEVRDVRGAERVLASAIASGMEPNGLMSMMMTAVTDHFYMDGGHTLDFHNKAFENLAAYRQRFRCARPQLARAAAGPRCPQRGTAALAIAGQSRRSAAGSLPGAGGHDLVRRGDACFDRGHAAGGRRRGTAAPGLASR